MTANQGRMATPAEALDEILGDAGRPLRGDDTPTIRDGAPILPTNFLPEVAGTATVAAVGIAAADLWEIRTGRRQSVATSRLAGAAAVSAIDYLQLDGGPPPGVWDPISGFYPTRDGRWVQFHCNYPHHRAGVVKRLGCADDKESVTRAAATWDAQELEDAMAAAGMCCSKVRHREEWAAHPHAAALAELPLIEVIRIGDGDPEPLPPGPRPLSGIRVVDVTRVLAGPTCGRTLGEHGADVMRISGPGLPFVQTLVMDTGHGKLAAEIDLKKAEGRAAILNLVRGADVFSQGYRPAALAALGLAPEDLAKARPGIVCVSLCAYSHAGPWSGRRGFDTLVQSASGIAWENGDGTRPKHMPGNPLDYCSGYLGAFGAMLALARRAREGGSWLVRISLAQTGRWIDRLGRVQGEDRRMAQPLARAALSEMIRENDSAFGRLSSVGPTVALSETPPFWSRPVVALGTHAPVWPS